MWCKLKSIWSVVAKSLIIALSIVTFLAVRIITFESLSTIAMADGIEHPAEPQRKQNSRVGPTIKLRGRIWYVYFHHRGKPYWKSSHSENPAVARRLLKKLLAEMGAGKLVSLHEDRVSFEDLSDALITDYKINERRSLRSAELSIAHLKKAFALDRAVDITTELIKTYILSRQQDGAANASINRELSCLKRMFRLAIQGGRLANAPYIPMLEENNVRQGFLEHGDFLALRDGLPNYLKDPITFLYLSGWRFGEMHSLEWRDLDSSGNLIRLRPENSKNKNSRILPLHGELRDVIARAREKRRINLPLIFHHDGRRIGDIRKAWFNACKAAGLSRMLVHDLRRTAVRNMVRSGIPERVAMSLSGHKTRSVFDRYHIVSESDLAEAAERLQTYLGTQAQTRKIVPIAS